MIVKCNIILYIFCFFIIYPYRGILYLKKNSRFGLYILLKELPT